MVSSPPNNMKPLFKIAFRVRFLFSASNRLLPAKLVFIGRGDKNIHVGRLDPTTGALTGCPAGCRLLAPYVCASPPSHHFLYAGQRRQTPEKSAISLSQSEPMAH